MYGIYVKTVNLMGSTIKNATEFWLLVAKSYFPLPSTHKLDPSMGSIRAFGIGIPQVFAGMGEFLHLLRPQLAMRDGVLR